MTTPTGLCRCCPPAAACSRSE